MSHTPNPELIDEENPEWTDDMFAHATPMNEADPELVRLSIQARDNQLENGEKLIRLETDVAKIFPDSNAVNEALRFLIRITAEHQSLSPM